MVNARLPDWPERLQAVIDQHARARFEWGSHDCCQLAIAAIRAVAGRSFEPGAYASERGAVRVLARLGGFDGAVCAAGGEPVHRGLAQRGDLVLVPQPGLFGSALAVCMGPVALAAGADGLVTVPRSAWLAAWRV